MHKSGDFIAITFMLVILLSLCMLNIYLSVCALGIQTQDVVDNPPDGVLRVCRGQVQFWSDFEGKWVCCDSWFQYKATLASKEAN